jgi:phosphoheptose isomerase
MSRRFAIPFTVACLQAHAIALAQTVVRLGSEFQINTRTVDVQRTTVNRSVDFESNGDFVMVWSGSSQDGDGGGVFGQRFTSAGARVGSEFQVSSYTVGGQTYPAVALDADGDFVVAWWSSGQDGSSFGVFARRFTSSGSAQGSDFQVNTFTSGIQFYPAVAREAGGDFVVVWASLGQDGSSFGVFARRFTSSGSAQGSELQVNTHTASSQFFPAVDLDQDGDFVVAWGTDGQDGDNYGVFGQRFDSLGARQGAELQVNAFVTSTQSRPAVGLDADGDFVVAWESNGQDGDGNGVFARRFASSGAPLGAETQINTYATGEQAAASLAVDAGGDFVVAWHSYQDGAGSGVFARHFRSSGVQTTEEIQVNTTTAGNQRFPTVRSAADGDFGVVWTSDPQDGSFDGVFGQRYAAPALLDIDGNGELGPLTDGLLLLRFLFGFTGTTLTASAVGPGCTRCDAAAILPYLPMTQAPARLGAEFQVNTVTLDYQRTRVNRSVDFETNGDFVVVWNSGTQDGSLDGVFGQRFASSGARLGSEFQVTSYTQGSQYYAAVALDADGDFVVAWTSTGQDGDADGVFARRFDSSGSALGGELQVNTFTSGRQNYPVIARDADGDFVVAWASEFQDGYSSGVFARRFSSSGSAQGGELQVNSHTAGDQFGPAVDLDQDGDFVVTWASAGQDGDGDGVFGQRFDSLGARQGFEFQVNIHFTNGQYAAAVGLDADGDFVVVWSSRYQDGDDSGVFARRFDRTGAPLGAEMQINVYVTGDQFDPSVGVDADGHFVVAWISYAQDGDDDGVFARHFRSSGAPTSVDLPVNTATAGNQRFAAVRSDAGRDFAIVWSSYPQDGSGDGVFGQRFEVPPLFDIDGDGQLSALTDGLLVLRFLFGFTGTTLTAGAVGPGCTRCDAAAILPYLQSLS